ncbi:hypothetical protein [Bacillus paranthracis]|uniref:hypothetical protein n=1 Tax=Bacillus paranthracis TaxID=2026186 RepID=UPI002E2460C7|nr:hypothetical protein [Bacillus paranthracis]MED1679894.1 hypothetical protein [Bacillus paranthracis]
MGRMYFNEANLDQALQRFERLIQELHAHVKVIDSVYNMVSKNWSQGGVGKKAVNDILEFRKGLTERIHTIEAGKHKLKSDWDLIKALDRSYEYMGPKY